jgi:hypothetical protein
MNDIRYGRKRNGIKKELDEKVRGWIHSIKDEEVRKLARENVIVTGGSIPSMFLGEEVNDYDVYFKTKEATHKVALYYAKLFRELNPDSGILKVKLENLINAKNEVEERVVIFKQSDGVVAEVPPELQSVKLRDEKKDVKYRPIFLSQNAITLSDKFQIVTRFYGDPEEIHDNYDFAHAMCYWDHKEKYLHTTTEALEALLSRTLIYRGSLYPIASIFRTKKFLNRGWRISAGQLLKIMWQISELDLSDKAVLREQLTGVDQAYLQELLDALKSYTGEIDSTYVCDVIDHIFEE